MSSGHLTPETVGAFVDGELDPVLESTALLHLEGCHGCSLRVLQAHQLKAATKKAAAGRFVPSADAMKRMTAQVAPQRARRASVIPLRGLAWSAVAAVVLVGISLGVWRQSRQKYALDAELLDQHLASLSASSAPQVISTDKHTVKPWFQGKLPFSFNIPDATALPADTTLQGANLAYVQGKPAAMLLFLNHKHRASVFLSQAGQIPRVGFVTVRSGFNIESAEAAGLDIVAVSDVSQADLDELLRRLANAQR